MIKRKDKTKDRNIVRVCGFKESELLAENFTSRTIQYIVTKGSSLYFCFRLLHGLEFRFYDSFNQKIFLVMTGQYN